MRLAFALALALAAPAGSAEAAWRTAGTIPVGSIPRIASDERGRVAIVWPTAAGDIAVLSARHGRLPRGPDVSRLRTPPPDARGALSGPAIDDAAFSAAGELVVAERRFVPLGGGGCCSRTALLVRSPNGRGLNRVPGVLPEEFVGAPAFLGADARGRTLLYDGSLRAIAVRRRGGRLRVVSRPSRRGLFLNATAALGERAVAIDGVQTGPETTSLFLTESLGTKIGPTRPIVDVEGVGTLAVVPMPGGRDIVAWAAGPGQPLFVARRTDQGLGPADQVSGATDVAAIAGARRGSSAILIWRRERPQGKTRMVTRIDARDRLTTTQLSGPPVATAAPSADALATTRRGDLLYLWRENGVVRSAFLASDRRRFRVQTITRDAAPSSDLQGAVIAPGRTVGVYARANGERVIVTDRLAR